MKLLHPYSYSTISLFTQTLISTPNIDDTQPFTSIALQRGWAPRPNAPAGAPRIRRRHLWQLPAFICAPEEKGAFFLSGIRFLPGWKASTLAVTRNFNLNVLVSMRGPAWYLHPTLCGRDWIVCVLVGRNAAAIGIFSPEERGGECRWFVWLLGRPFVKRFCGRLFFRVFVECSVFCSCRNLCVWISGYGAAGGFINIPV